MISGIYPYLVLNGNGQEKEVFEKLQEDGQIMMPLQETFWSPLYGQVTDKFGVTWQISTQLTNNK